MNSELAIQLTSVRDPWRPKEKKKRVIPYCLTLNHVSGFFFTLTMKSKSLSITQNTFHDFASSRSPDSFLSLSSCVFNTPVRSAHSVTKSTSPFRAWCPWTYHYIFLHSLFSDFFLPGKFLLIQKGSHQNSAPSYTPYLGEVSFSLSPNSTHILFSQPLPNSVLLTILLICFLL